MLRQRAEDHPKVRDEVEKNDVIVEEDDKKIDEDMEEGIEVDQNFMPTVRTFLGE